MLISKTINSALRKIGVLTAQDEASPSDSQLGLDTLNRIIDSYNTENLIVTYLQDVLIAQPTNGWTSTITIGTGQQIDTSAPVQIEGLYWREGGTDYKSEIMSPSQWQMILTKGNIKIPTRHYIQRADENYIKINFDSIPQAGLTLHLLAKMPYTGVNGVGKEYLPTDDINWTTGFEKMLMYRLAVELAPDFEVQVSQIVTSLAMDSEMKLKAYNYQPMTLESDVSLTRSVISKRGY